MVFNDDFENELIQFVEFVNAFKDERDEGVSQENFMYQLIFKKQVHESFPNVEILLIYLVLMVNNYSAERSFTKLKLIKSRLRSSTCNDRLAQLALMSLEADILREINFEDVVTDFFKEESTKSFTPLKLISNFSCLL